MPSAANVVTASALTVKRGAKEKRRVRVLRGAATAEVLMVAPVECARKSTLPSGAVPGGFNSARLRRNRLESEAKRNSACWAAANDAAPLPRTAECRWVMIQS